MSPFLSTALSPIGCVYRSMGLLFHKAIGGRTFHLCCHLNAFRGSAIHDFYCLPVQKWKKKTFLTPLTFFCLEIYWYKFSSLLLKKAQEVLIPNKFYSSAMLRSLLCAHPPRINGSRRLGTSHPMNAPLFDYFRRLLNVCTSAESWRCLIKRLRGCGAVTFRDWRELKTKGAPFFLVRTIDKQCAAYEYWNRHSARSWSGKQ